jgi:hypothetical protein
MTTTEPKFEIGQLVATRAVALRVPGLEALALVERHQRGDWGDTDPEDAKQNEEALKHGGRLHSVYKNPGTEWGTVWVITEHDRSVTTVLFPDDY